MRILIVDDEPLALDRLEAFLADVAGAEVVGVSDYTALPEGETAIEMSYGLQLTPWLNIRPDVQYIVDPGAFSYRTTHDALALGVQVKMQI